VAVEALAWRRSQRNYPFVVNCFGVGVARRKANDNASIGCHDDVASAGLFRSPDRASDVCLGEASWAAAHDGSFFNAY
jgi:hypothetical protein